MSEVIKAKMIEGVLFIEATEYQLGQARYEVLSTQYEKLRTEYDRLKAETQALISELNDED